MSVLRWAISKQNKLGLAVSSGLDLDPQRLRRHNLVSLFERLPLFIIRTVLSNLINSDFNVMFKFGFGPALQCFNAVFIH
jgi:hypothetical protein